ncbi:unnamed protein product, partial [Rotaria sordida]
MNYILLFIISDLQTINITLRILYRARAELLPKSFTNLGLDYEERVLPSITNEISKSVVTHLSFGPEFTSAVELKQVAQQDIEK